MSPAALRTPPQLDRHLPAQRARHFLERRDRDVRIGRFECGDVLLAHPNFLGKFGLGKSRLLTRRAQLDPCRETRGHRYSHDATTTLATRRAPGRERWHATTHQIAAVLPPHMLRVA